MNKNKKLSEFARLMGKRGARSRAKKYTHEDFVRWGKIGGRPKGSKNKKKKYRVEIIWPKKCKSNAS